MSQSAVAARTCRLLFFGPAGAGKRDNLRQISDSIPQEHRLAVEGEDQERQIAFRLRSGEQGDWTVLVQAVDTGTEIYQQVQGYPGQSFDGVVLVVHSAVSRLDQSLSSLEALKSYLESWGKDVMSVPLVIQYNQRDEEGCLPIDRLESLLNPWNLLSFPASTRQGEGVKETLKAILSLSISALIQDPRPAETAESSGSGAGDECPPDEAVRRETGQEPVPEPRSVPDPGTPGLQIETEEKSGIFFNELRPPIILPVRVPRSLLDKYGSVRIILELEVDESDSMLG